MKVNGRTGRGVGLRFFMIWDFKGKRIEFRLILKRSCVKLKCGRI